MLAKPMILAGRSLHIKADQMYFTRTPINGQVERLRTAVGVVMDRPRISTEAHPRTSVNPVQAVGLGGFAVLRPALAFEALRDVFRVVAPPGFVAGVEDLRLRPELPAVVDGEDEAPLELAGVALRSAWA